MSKERERQRSPSWKRWLDARKNEKPERALAGAPFGGKTKTGAKKSLAQNRILGRTTGS
jgi:hypothetical protein